MYSSNGFNIREFTALDSTNGEAWRRLEELDDRSVILTAQQTGGRGHGGSAWESEAGKNITMTILLKPRQLPAGEQFLVSMLVSLATRDLVERYVDGCTVKWPNDVYVGNRKIAGILIEHVVARDAISLSLCGVGLNVNQTRFTSGAPNPVSLCQLLGGELPMRQVLDELLAALDARLRAPRDIPGTQREYVSCLYRGTGVHAWEDEEGIFTATIRGVNEYGQLLLEDETGQRRAYGFKEVGHVL
ncbi:MAG: biotin--[acetyl-CoA-carboxylase] ligase [Odoribacteraceae bacterium]|jgi:BirA family biotin operon repressor/biotin-[acetyl-CoA-carboxylase] ligase|nr:biotin--[acetyl-CoA-carboxylase] ligase [Odoribacteraceae bacterium]